MHVEVEQRVHSVNFPAASELKMLLLKSNLIRRELHKKELGGKYDEALLEEVNVPFFVVVSASYEAKGKHTAQTDMHDLFTDELELTLVQGDIIQVTEPHLIFDFGAMQ
jgi:hypothetical protein